MTRELMEGGGWLCSAVALGSRIFSFPLSRSAPTSYSRVGAFYFACFFHYLNFVERPASDWVREFVQPPPSETEFLILTNFAFLSMPLKFMLFGAKIAQ